MHTSYKLQLALDAQANESYAEAFSLLIDCLESAANTQDAPVMAAGLMAFAENVLEWCPCDSDPFELRRQAAQEALKIFRDIGDRKGEANALLILATVNFDRTKELDEEALAIARQVGDNSLIARALCHLGNEDLISGASQEATQRVAEASEYAEASNDLELVADTVFVLGTVQKGGARLAAFERMARLEDCYHRKRRFVRRLSAAASLISEDMPERAAEWFNRCISVARGLSDVQMEGGLLHGLARIERARGNTAKADELQALADVMCPLPDPANVIKAVEARDKLAVQEELMSLVRRNRKKGSGDE